MEEGEEEEGQEESEEVKGGNQVEEITKHMDDHDDGREWSADKART